MILKDLLKIIYRPKTATYHICIAGSATWWTLNYEQIHKARYQEREIIFIENMSPDKYCFNNWWICLKHK